MDTDTSLNLLVCLKIKQSVALMCTTAVSMIIIHRKTFSLHSQKKGDRCEAKYKNIQASNVEKPCKHCEKCIYLLCVLDNLAG